MKLNLETFIQMLAGGGGLLESMAWKSLVIVTLVVVVTALWRHGAATARHLAWTTTFLCLLCLPVFVQFIPVWHPPTWIIPASLNNSLPDSVSFVSQKLIHSETKLLPAVSENAGGASDSTRNTSSTLAVKRVAVGWGGFVVAIWFAGMILGGARWLAVQIWLHRLTRQMQVCKDSDWLKLVENLRLDYQIQRPVKLLISDTSITPITWGFWKPVVVLSAESRQWPSERLHIVLRHELAHVKRWDCLTQEMAHAACVLYWFNPLVWLAANRMRAEREKACDDFVLNTGARPAEYAGHLVEIAQQFVGAPHFSGAVAMARPSGLEQRVMAILDAHRNRSRMATMTVAFIVASIFGLGLLIGGCSNKNSPEKWSLKHSAASAQLKAFVSEKEAQANTFAKAEGKEVPSEFKSLFAAAAKGDFQTVTNFYADMRKHSPQYGGHDQNLRGPMWQTALETEGAFEQFAGGSEKYAIAFGNDIIKSIPAGSVYFGGTDSGRFIITAMCKSQPNGDPFFTLTQNALADGTYLDYLRSMYGGKIYIPTAEDSQKSFLDYTEDATRRQQNHQLKPGEDVKVTEGRVQVSGVVAVMEINGLLVKTIFDKTPDREFYIEESFPLDWMYPNLEPHGLIFKINRQPLPELSGEIIQRDHDYWTKYIRSMIGDWLNDDTSVEAVTIFSEKVFLRHDFSGFTGDPQFVQNEYSCKMFSKLRSSIAGLYVWRMNQAATADEKERMAREADFAYRQALALCPYSPEAAKGYTDFLKNQNRDSDTALVGEMAKQFPKQK